MPAKKYQVVLSAEERTRTEQIARSYKRSARERRRARLLLLADAGEGDAAISQSVGVTQATVQNVRRRFATGGWRAALEHKAQQRRKARVLDGEGEAFLIATCCSAPPDGYKRWSLHLLANTVVQAGYCQSISHETVRQTLKKTISSRG